MFKTIMKDKFNLQHCCLQQMQKYLPDRFSFWHSWTCQRLLKAKEAFSFISMTLGNKLECKTQYITILISQYRKFLDIILAFLINSICYPSPIQNIILSNKTFTIAHSQVRQHVTGTKYFRESIYSVSKLCSY